MKRSSLLFSGIALLVFSCIKEKKTPEPETPVLETTELSAGLPAKRAPIHGYLYASQVSYVNGGGSFLSGTAVFNDPATDLMGGFDHYIGQPVVVMGNVGTGTVTFDNFTFGQMTGGVFFYSLQGRNLMPGYTLSPVWRSDGNKSFKPLDQTISRGFPVITSTSSYTADVDQDFKLSFGSFISNFDSLIVAITDQTNFSIYKRVSSGTEVVFTKADLYRLSYQSMGYKSMSFLAFNYSNRIINGKQYVFELATQLQTNIMLTP